MLLRAIFSSLIIVFVFVCSPAHAEERNFSDKFSYHQEVTKGQLILGIESTQIQTSGGSLMGYGPRLGIDYALNSRFSINPNVSFVMDGQNLISSGINTFLKYTVLGALTSTHEILDFEGHTVFEQKQLANNRLAFGAGLEQLFLNGSQSIYPATGLSVLSSYSFRMFNNQFEVNARYSQLVANSKSVNAIFVGFSFLLGL